MIMELNSGLVCQSNSRGILVICLGALVPPSGLTIAKFTGPEGVVLINQAKGMKKTTPESVPATGRFGRVR